MRRSIAVDALVRGSPSAVPQQKGPMRGPLAKNYPVAEHRRASARGTP